MAGVRARARWGFVGSFVVTVVACGASDDIPSDNATDADAGAAAVVPEAGTTSALPEAGVAPPTDAGTTTQARDSSTTQPHGGCGLTLKGPHWNLSCQQWMNNNCCAEQLACAADAGCQALVDCIGACKGQNTDACVATCQGNATGGQSLLSAMGNCSKTPPSDGGAAIAAKCAWP